MNMGIVKKKCVTVIKNPEIDVTHLLDISNYQIIYKSIKL